MGRIALGIVAVLGGSALIAIASWQMFAEGVRADATGTAGTVPTIAVLLGTAGIIGVVWGFVSIVAGAADSGRDGHDDDGTAIASHSVHRGFRAGRILVT